MFTFTSVHNKFVIYGKPVDKEPEFIVRFQPIGSMGRFNTDSEELAAKLRSHPDFGKKFLEIGIKARENPNIVRGIRSSVNQPELGKEDLIEFGMLKATLLKNDGTYRKDASEENIKKFEVLKQSLGE